MKRVVVYAAVVASFAAVSAVAQAPTPEAAATAPAAVDALAEAARIVEVDANTTANLTRAIAMFDAALVDTNRPVAERADGWSALSRAWLRLGDLQSGEATKIASYEKGKAAGAKALELTGNKHAEGMFWTTANQACIGRTRGVMNSLFMLGDLRKGMNASIALNPSLVLPRNTLAEIDHSVPSLAGGSDERAEQGLLAVLKANPHMTSTMFLMARIKRDQGKTDEAKMWAQKVVDEKAPARRNDWRKFDLPDAKKMLAELAE
jgi:hypothetical protein